MVTPGDPAMDTHEGFELNEYISNIEVKLFWGFSSFSPSTFPFTVSPLPLQLKCSISWLLCFKVYFFH